MEKKIFMILLFTEKNLRNSYSEYSRKGHNTTKCVNKVDPMRSTFSKGVEDRRKCASLPAEKGRNAGFFLKFPLLSRKCWGLKDRGVAYRFSSFSTECNKGIISVSC